jgi:DNA-binding MarR family transcriptional regulator
MYKKFILSKFTIGKRIIDSESIELVLDWTKGYTFYTQSVCNRLYNHKKIDVTTVKKECNNLLSENESTYLQYRKLITSNQWDFLVALAKEENITQVYTNDFLKKYNLGTPSSTSRILKSLIEKELILETIGTHETNYCVYDVFMMRWLQKTY